MATEIVGLVLAAGASRRFGQADKLLQPVDDGIAMAIQSAQRAAPAVDDLVVVVRTGSAELEAAIARAGLAFTRCDDADEGMGRSIAAGVRARPGAAGWLIALADMPWVQTDSVRRVAAALRAGADVARPRHAGQAGHPVGFSARHRLTLENLQGDEGARAAARQAETTYLDVEDPGVVLDVDTPTALTRRPSGGE